MKQLNILDEKQVVCSGFVTYTQEVVDLAKAGYTLDVRSARCPNFMLGLFTCNMLLLEDETSVQLGGGEVGIAEEATAVEQPKPKRAYTKNGEMKAQLEQKLGNAAKSVR